jgi:hypothetical protein
MVRNFEEIFEEVMIENEIEEWYELFDSDDFEIVEERIVKELGKEILKSEEYNN